MKNKSLLLLLAITSLSSCTAADFRKQIGIEKEAPDEFLVMPRDKLVIPTAAVELPKPTKEVEGHIAASENARKALYGESVEAGRPNTVAENAILAKANANDADSSIRKTVDKEYKGKTGAFGTDRGGMMESIVDPFGYNQPKEPVVDAKEENKRIREALRKGEKIDASKVKTKNPANMEKVKEEGVI